MAKQNISLDQVGGLFIYHDEHKNVVFSNPFMKSGYIITKSNLQKYTTYSLRIAFSICLMVVVALVSKKYLFAVGAGTVVYLVTTLLFYFKYLPTLTRIDEFKKPKKDNFIITNAKRIDISKLIMLTIVACLTAIVSVANIIFTDYDTASLYLNIAITVLFFAIAICNICSLIIKKKRNW